MSFLQSTGNINFLKIRGFYGEGIKARHGLASGL
jgi:hypothetical protein